MPPLIFLVSTGQPETGLWCDRCLLPSRIRFTVYVTTEHGSRPIGVIDACQDCGHRREDA